jgi:hypothetical protein
MQRLRISGETSFALLWMVPFTVLGASTTLHHEMWRDELQAWLIALESSSLRELLHHLAREGTPAAWHLMLMLLTRFSDRPEAMQVLHLAVACTTAYLCLRLAPLTRVQRVLLVFGYFFSYEYLAIARSYSLTALCLVIACAAWTRAKPMVGLTAGALFVLCQTSFPGLVLALAFTAGLIVEDLLGIRHAPRVSRLVLTTALCVVMVGFVIATWQVWPSSTPAVATSAKVVKVGAAGHGVRDALGLLPEVFIPIPRARVHFWTSSWLWDGSFPRLQLVVGVIVLLYSVASTARRPAAIMTYVSAAGVLTAFFCTRFWGVVRHHGMIYLAFVAAVWLAQSPCCGGKAPRWWTASRRARSLVLTALLVTQVVGAAIAIWWEHRIAFSQGRAVADYLRQQDLDDEVIVAYHSFAGATVAGYLRGKKLYYIEEHGFGTFVTWGSDSKGHLGMRDLLAAMKGLEDRFGRKPLLLLNALPPPAQLAPYGLQQVQAFGGPTAVSNEVFSLYRLTEGR